MSKFIINFLSRPQTTSAAVYRELGRFPLDTIRKMRIIKFWYRIKQNPDSLLSRLLLNFDNVNTHITNWSNNVKRMLQDLGLTNMYHKDNLSIMDVNCIFQNIRTYLYKNG